MSNLNQWPLITWLTLTPIMGAIVVGLFVRRAGAARAIAIIFNLIAFAFVVLLICGFKSDSTGLQFIERHAWIPSLSVEYFAGIDGLGLLMVLLSAMVVPFAVLASRPVAERPHLYYSLMLLLQAGLFGSFTALNFFHWFLFWEASLVPAYFLIKLWGGPGRVAAATQFFIYTLVGSITLLLAFVAIYLATDTFDFIRLVELRRDVQGGLAAYFNAKIGPYGLSEHALAALIFAGVLLAFAVKVPLFPFHTWVPFTYGEAPPAVTMVLTGAMSKMGVYGFLRIVVPLFPEQLRWGLPVLIALAVATIVFSAFAAFAQRDLRRTMAYSSINHLGYCLLGIFVALKSVGAEDSLSQDKAAVLNGVILQMFNHGITAAALFCFIGFLEARVGTSELTAFGGLGKVAPVFSGLMGISIFASLGLPGLNGFVGEFLIFKGVFPLATSAAVVSTMGLLATAIFLLTILQRVWSGPLPEQWRAFPDLTLAERCVIFPAVALMLLLGIWPQLILNFSNPAVLQILRHVRN